MARKTHKRTLMFAIIFFLLSSLFTYALFNKAVSFFDGNVNAILFISGFGLFVLIVLGFAKMKDIIKIF